MKKSTVVHIDHHPGRSTQTIGLARELGTDPDLIHEPSVGVVGTKGDSQCYLGVAAKVEAIHAALKSRIGKEKGQLKLRLVQPEFTIATSDGIRNGTREMRYSLIGREVTHDALCEHLSATGLAGTIAVVACDKPPVGTLAALLEHNQPGIIMSDTMMPTSGLRRCSSASWPLAALRVCTPSRWKIRQTDSRLARSSSTTRTVELNGVLQLQTDEAFQDPEQQ